MNSCHSLRTLQWIRRHLPSLTTIPGSFNSALLAPKIDLCIGLKPTSQAIVTTITMWPRRIWRSLPYLTDELTFLSLEAVAKQTSSCDQQQDQMIRACVRDVLSMCATNWNKAVLCVYTWRGRLNRSISLSSSLPPFPSLSHSPLHPSWVNMNLPSSTFIMWLFP